MIAAVTAWAVRRMTAPLAALAAAAERLGRDVDAPPLPETGSVEIRGASHAFNTMQTRLRRLVENRTQMLVAISHDMRTQLMLLRLAEAVINKEEGSFRALLETGFCRKTQMKYRFPPSWICLV